jgi:Bacterial Ig-like domain (group 3)
VTATSAEATAGQTVTYTAHITPADAGADVPTGTVGFADGSTTIAGCASQPVSASGLAGCTVTRAVGSHSITATYGGDANFNGSTAAVASPSTDLRSEARQPSGGQRRAARP